MFSVASLFFYCYICLVFVFIYNCRLYHSFLCCIFIHSCPCFLLFTMLYFIIPSVISAYLGYLWLYDYDVFTFFVASLLFLRISIQHSRYSPEILLNVVSILVPILGYCLVFLCILDYGSSCVLYILVSRGRVCTYKHWFFSFYYLLFSLLSDS